MQEVPGGTPALHPGTIPVGSLPRHGCPASAVLKATDMTVVDDRLRRAAGPLARAELPGDSFLPASVRAISAVARPEDPQHRRHQPRKLLLGSFPEQVCAVQRRERPAATET